MLLTTLCYLEKDGAYLMLLRNKKKSDVNEGKWIAPGGKFEDGETPEECVCREVKEETGLILDDCRLRGVLTFASEGWDSELIFVYTADRFHGTLTECEEGELRWVAKEDIMRLNLWEGDRIFLKLLLENTPYFSLKLSYRGDNLVEQKLLFPTKGHLAAPPPFEPLTAKDIDKLARQALRVIPKKVAAYAVKMGVTYGRITIRNQKTRWGSCSSKGNLNFNCLLMLAPEEVLDYVIIHELAHRREMNHSRAFWNVVAEQMPDYKEKIHWLNEHGDELMRRMAAGAKR